MSDRRSLKPLRVGLVLTGMAFIGLYGMTVVWPSGWSWGHGHSHYLTMILGVYATLGVFLVAAARDPYANRSLIWFTVWSSAAHAAIMLAQSLVDPMEHGHLAGDVPALFVIAAGLAVLMKRSEQAAS